MPGSMVSDVNDPQLISATVTANTNHSAVQVNVLDRVRAECIVGAVSGTSPTLQIDVQASDDNTFATGVVTLGTFVLQANDATTTRWLLLAVKHRYVRAVSTVGGTSPSFAVVLNLRERHYHETKTDTET